MSLPKINTPIISVEMPDRDVKLKIKQLTTGDYKNLLVALQMNDVDTYINTFSTIIENNVVEPANFKINKLYGYEVDWLFLQMYSASVSGDIKIKLTCNNEVEKTNEETNETETSKCGTQFNIAIRTSDVKVTEKPNPIIEIPNTNIGLKLKYPDWDIWQRLVADAVEETIAIDDGKTLDNNEITKSTKLIYQCLESVYDGDKLYTEFTLEDFAKWLDDLDPVVMNNIENFFANTPQLYHTMNVICPRCKNQEEYTTLGFIDFLT